jgi:hypothetical protein
MIEYGYYFVNDLTRAFYPITDYDELPENIQDYELPLGTPLWADDGTPGVAVLPAGFTLPDFATLVPGGASVVVPNQGFVVDGPFYDPANPDIAFIPPIPYGRFDADVLPPIWVTGGNSLTGTLTINDRTAATYVRRSGDDRLLIQSLGTAIENHGTLTVNDSRIEAYDVGILHEYSRSVSIDPDDDTNIYYGMGTPASLILNNTQIGRPDGDTVYIIGYDPITGDPITTTISGGPGIKVNSVGVPEPTRTFIRRGDKMMAEGINGRIVAGSDVTMSRYPVGSVAQRSPNTEAQEVIYNLNNINGPSIGILAQAHAFHSGRMELVNANSRYYANYLSEGMLDQSGGYYASVPNAIQLRDNSWIFAGTGISFGNTGTYPGEEAIRILVDSTSGIYAGGYGYYYYDPFY